MTDLPLRGLNWGVDIGGTTVIAGYLYESGFRSAISTDTDASAGPGQLVERLAGLITATDPSPASLGVGIAGLVDTSKGRLVFSPNLPGWGGFPLSGELSRRLACPVALDNDCNVFALQALRTGSIPCSGLWLMVTLGTGIGGTIMSEGSVIYGTGFAGEFGHMTVDAGGKPCPCGSKGCWERYASASSLVEYHAAAGGGKLPPKVIAEQAGEGVPEAQQAFRELGRWLGTGLASLCSCFSPHGIFLAGGIAGAAEHFMEYAREEFALRRGRAWNVAVLPSASEAGAEGAAMMGRDLTG